MWGLPLTCTFLIILETYITLYLNKSRSVDSPGLHPLALTPALPQQAMRPSCKVDLRSDEHSRMNLSPFCCYFPDKSLPWSTIFSHISPLVTAVHAFHGIKRKVDKGCGELLCFSDLKPWTLLLPWAALSSWRMLPGQALSLQSNTTIRYLVSLWEYRAGHHSYKLLVIW